MPLTLLTNEIAPQQMSLSDLLTTFDGIDSGEIQVSAYDLDRLQTALLTKIDAIRYVIAEWQSAAERHTDFAAEHLDQKKIFEKKIQRLKETVSFVMRRNKFEKLTGDEWQISLRRSESVETVGDPDDGMAELFPTLIRKSYAWNKTEIKELLKSGHALPFAQVKENYSPQFKVKSEK